MPLASHRINVMLIAGLTIVAVVAHALIVPGYAARIRNYGACVLGAAIALFCAVVDSHYTTGAVTVLAGAALRVLGAASAAASSHIDPLEVIASSAVFMDASVCSAVAVALAAPMLAAADAIPRRRLGRAALIATTAVVMILGPGSVVFHHNVPRPVGLCAAFAADSVRGQLVLLSSAIIATSLLSAAVLLQAPAPVIAVRFSAVAVAGIALCVAASIGSDWRSFSAICPEAACGPSRADTAVLVAQLLRLGTVAVILPLMFASVAALFEPAPSDDDDEDENSSTPKHVETNERVFTNSKLDPTAVV